MIALICLCYFFIFHGGYYDAYEGIVANIINGIWYQNTELTEFWFTDHGFLLIGILSKLNRVFDVPLLGIFYVLLFFFALTLLNIIFSRALRAFPVWAVTVFLLLLDVFVVHYFIFQVTNVATSFLLLFTALVVLLNRERFSISAWQIYPFVLVGILLRIQIFPFAALLALFFSLIEKRDATRVKLLVKTLVVPAVFFLFVYAFFFFNWRGTENYGIHFLDKYELNILVRENVAALSPSADYSEQLRYKALTELFFYDSDQMPDEYLGSVIKYKTHVEYLLHINEFKSVYADIANQVIYDLTSRSLNYLLFYFGLFGILFLLSLYFRSFAAFFINAAFLASFTLIVGVLSMFIAVDSRFIAPFFIVGLIILIYSIIYMVEDYAAVSMTKRLWFYLGLSIVPGICSLAFIHAESGKAKEENRLILNTYCEINEVARGGMVFLIEAPWDLTHRNILSSPCRSNNHNILVFQRDFITYLPPVTAKISPYLNGRPATWENKIELIHANAGRSYIVTNKVYRPFLIDYFKTFYGIELYDLQYYKAAIPVVEETEIFSFSSRRVAEGH